MKKLLSLSILCLAMFFTGALAGCTVTETQAQRNTRLKSITDLQMRMLVEDWDYLWLYERSSGMTQWHTRVGI